METNTIMARYHAKAFTNHYIVGFKLKGSLYVARMDGESLTSWTKLTQASRGQGMAARLRPDYWQKLAAVNDGAEVVCSLDELESLTQDSRYNRGEVFEQMIYEQAGQSWHKESTPFWQAGDIVIDGISYQIKLENATFTNEKYLEKIGA